MVDKTRFLVDPNEKALFAVLAIMAGVTWFILALSTLGMIFVFLFFMWIFFLFIQSRFISYIVGTGAIVTEQQFPDLHKMYEECCDKLNMKKKPTMILLHMDGMFNAFATRFLRKHYVILLADVVDALEDEPEAIKFYIGHELGHVSRNHIMRGMYLSLVSWLPLLGAGYSRACEVTCDRHGLACCDNEDSAVKAMSALAVGGKRWKTMNVPAYLEQKQLIKGFWMSFHEVISDYPWLVRRVAYLHQDTDKSSVPSRNPFAWVLGFFVPRLSIASLIVIYILIFGGVGAIGAMKEMEKTLGGLSELNYDQPYDEYGDEYDYSDYGYEGESYE